MSPNKKYDETFFDYTSSISGRSAKLLIPCIKKCIRDINSVIDFGCAKGVWLKSWRDAGVSIIKGVDGDYVDRSSIFVPDADFITHNLNESIKLEQYFDLVTSFEVAEHIEHQNSDNFIRSLTNHADVIVFSAAPPGQGGEHHINEQPFDYWRELFAEYGYSPYDCIRPKSFNQKDIVYWYRYNIFVYANKRGAKRLSEEARNTLIPNHIPLKDISPNLFKLRKWLLRSFLSAKYQNRLAMLKSRLTSN